MKQLILNIILFLCFSSLANAQNQDRVRNIHLQGGTVTGGLNISTGFERLFGKNHTNSFYADINYQRLNRSSEVSEMLFKEQNAFISFGYRKYLATSTSIIPYIGANVLAGYQHSGNTANGIFEYKSTRDFLYGAGLNTGIEYRVSRVSIYVEGSYMFEFNHSWMLNTGLKYYF